MLGPLKDAIRGVYVPNDEEVKNTLHSLLRTQPKTFFIFQRNHKVGRTLDQVH
jgi:hypothetical protein